MTATSRPVAPNDRGGFEALDPCVHCGFCLPACPTYLATGDEADSPRGRIHLMRALERGEIAATDAGLRRHLDACLGCRGCEPVCPSGVGYGRGLEAARRTLVQANGLPFSARAVLRLFRQGVLWRPLLAIARWIRGTGLSKRWAGQGRFRFPLGMLAATDPLFTPSPGNPRARGGGQTVALFRGCVMDGLFGHVHEATRRVLTVNGYRVIEITGQGCCGALHDHAGDQAGAKALASRNVAALAGRADFLVVNSAGCGALLKDLGHVLGGKEATQLALRVRDVTELLVAVGPRPGAALPLQVGYDAPCHLQHAQGIHQEPLAVLAAVPRLTVRLLAGYDRCCGSAGIYGVLHPELSQQVLADKIAAIEAAAPSFDLVATGNPGCLMQIGAGLAARGSRVRVTHPVELLDQSYRLAGFYD